MLLWEGGTYLYVLHLKLVKGQLYIFTILLHAKNETLNIEHKMMSRYAGINLFVLEIGHPLPDI